MRIKLAFAAITLALPSLMACNPQESAPDPCKVASSMSDLNRDFIRQASMDGASGDILTAYCQGLIDHPDDHSICDSPDWPEPVCDDDTIRQY